MQLMPMYTPAELIRRGAGNADGVMVAKGPLVIMAHGLLALAPRDRRGMRISSALADLTPTQAEAALRLWQGPAHS